MKNKAKTKRIVSSEAPFKLPSVGLPMLKALELEKDTSMKLNPFVVPKNTEMMLINNERQRIQEKMTKEKIKNAFKVHEKLTSNYRNRAGVIRDINAILPIDEHSGNANTKGLRRMTKRYDGYTPSHGEKINIFEGDPKEIDEKLALYDKEDQMAKHTRSLAHPVSETRTLDVHNKSKKWNSSANYLKTQLENRENRKEFVAQSRELLFKEISIRNKKEETEKLKEFIDTENEKLIEAKNSFNEDRDKFNKYVEELTLKAEKAKKDTEKLGEIKQKKSKRIGSLKDQLAEVNREISKISDEVETATADREFILDLCKELSTAAMKSKLEKKTSSKVSLSVIDFTSNHLR